MPAARAPKQAESLAPEVSRLVGEGNAAFAASQFVTPPGDNAMERYLAALQLDPSYLGAKEALVEVFPAATAAAERAIDAGDTREAARIIALIQRVSPESMAARTLQERLAKRAIGAAQSVEPAAAAPGAGGR
jgi:protein TonB